MEGGPGFLKWIQGRRNGRGPSRLLRAGLLGLWKAARRVPGAGRVRVPVTAGGFRLSIRAFSYDDLLVISSRYEACIADLLPPRGTVAVDAGAFIGLYALRYARAVQSEGRVIAVEPHPASFRLLERNVRRNGLSNVTCLEAALGCEQGEAWLAHQEETSTASLVRPQKRSIRVPLEPLDAVLKREGVDQIALLKIDVEGAELDVLKGAAETLARSPAVRLIVEVHDPPPDCEPRSGPVGAWLAARGYAIETRRDGERVFYVGQGDTRLPES